MARILLSLLFLFLTSNLLAQDAYWVLFTDKDGVDFDPYAYFDAHTIERRLKQGIPLAEFSDLPVRSDYISEVKGMVDEAGPASRWFNALPVRCEPGVASQLSALPFVSELIPMAMVSYAASSGEYDTVMSASMRKLMKQQTDAMGISYFREKGIDATGVRIAIFDAGFTGADISPAFDHIREGGRVLMTWDFKRKNENVYHGNTHGTSVWSCIGGMLNGQPLGMATGAEFILARTEGRGEPFSEETNWLAALEWADKNGADVINSSLGYTYNRYFPEQMDGKTSLVSRAATLAARKGILVVNAAGNEGAGGWEFMGAPADADSILSVGGVQPSTGYHTSFSSYGPTADGRLKPNISAFGHVTAASAKGFHKTQGTSFASPLAAGFVACAWQAFPDDNNMQLLERVERASSLYPYYDYAHGYGVPQAALLLGEAQKTEEPTFNPRLGEENWEFTPVMGATPAYSYPGSAYMYVHLSRPDGTLKHYWVLDKHKLSQDFSLPVDRVDASPGDIIRVFYYGYTEELTAK